MRPTLVTAQHRPELVLDVEPTVLPSTGVLPHSLMCRVLDEVDQGMILVNPNGTILHANTTARRELLTCGLLGQGGASSKLQATDPAAQVSLLDALRQAERDRRSIVELQLGSEAKVRSISLAFVPLRPSVPGAMADTILIVCGRRHAVQSLTLQMFSQARGLTGAEQFILGRLCDGQSAEDIAHEQGVCLSTVRTHIRNLRQKTSTTSIGETIQRVSRLPQIMTTLHRVTARM